jgi:hypothetical protein
MFVAGSQELILCDKMPSYKSQNKVLLYLSPSSNLPSPVPNQKLTRNRNNGKQR